LTVAVVVAEQVMEAMATVGEALEFFLGVYGLGE
jgi:hypothetical protein